MAARESLKLKFLQYLDELEREIKFSRTGSYSYNILYATFLMETILVNAFVRKILRLSSKLHVNR